MERFTTWTERYGHLWAGVILVAGVVIVGAVFYGIAYTILLIAC